jgi:PTS system nitrogen regulatory IIA component
VTRVEGDALVLADLEATDADGVLRALAELAAPAIAGVGPGELVSRFAERERLGSTAIGGGVAMPHCRCPELERALVLIARSRHGVPFGAADDLPVRLFVAVATPAAAPAEHLRTLARLSRRLRDRDRVAALLAAIDASALLDAWRRGADEAA